MALHKGLFFTPPSLGGPNPKEAVLKPLRVARMFVMLVQAMALAAAGMTDVSPGKFGFHIFPQAQGQDLGTASRPVPNGRGGFWFLDNGAIWLFDARGYRPLGPGDGVPPGSVEMAFPERSTGMWFLAGTTWCHLGRSGLQRLAEVPQPSEGTSFLPVRNEGFAVIRNGWMRILGPKGTAVAELPSPGPGAWVKGWKDPRGATRYVVGDEGLATWDGQAWKLERLRGFLDGRPWDVQQDKAGALWVRSDRDLVRLKPSRQRFGPRLGFTRNSFVSLEEGPFGRMWTNGPEGLACIDGDSVTRITEREGLYGYHSYWPIVFDADGSLWTISTEGFQRMKGGFLWRLEEKPQGLVRAMVFTTLRAPDGDLYAGTHDGLYRKGAGPWSLVKGTEGWALFSIAPRPGGELWTCGNPPWNDDTAVLRIRPGQPAAKAAIQGFPSGQWALGMLWTGPEEALCGTTKGLYRIRPRRGGPGDAFAAEPVALPGADPGTGVGWLDRTADGDVWAVSDAGLYLLEGGAWRKLGKAQGMAADEATGTFLGPGGEQWVVHGAANAITRMVRVPGAGWTVAGTFGKDHPLAANGPIGGWTDPKGVAWVLSSKGVVRWDGRRAELHSKGYGLPLDNLFENGISGDPDGRLWIGSISGLIAFDPRFYRPIPDPPALEDPTALDGEGRPFAAGARLAFHRAGITFGLQLPLVEGVEDLRIETRLKGQDDLWRPLAGDRLRLPGLPPGRYVLEARAARLDGQNGPALAFPFRILQPWYLTYGALALWAALAFALAWAIILWRTWTLRRDRARLEGVVDQRTSELRETNAQLVQALSEVKTLGGLVPICCYCKKIRDDDGFWSQLERYLQEHSNAKFSHGICPDCEQRARAELLGEEAGQ